MHKLLGLSKAKVTLVVTVDGQQVATKALPIGDFAWVLPMAATTGRHKVQLGFSDSAHTPFGFHYLVSAQIKELGFKV